MVPFKKFTVKKQIRIQDIWWQLDVILTFLRYLLRLNDLKIKLTKFAKKHGENLSRLYILLTFV